MFEEIVEEGGNFSGESQLDVEGRLARLCVGLHAWRYPNMVTAIPK